MYVCDCSTTLFFHEVFLPPIWRKDHENLTIWYVMEATVIVQKGPAYESATKAPSKGVKLAVPLKLVTVLAALVIGI